MYTPAAASIYRRNPSESSGLTTTTIIIIAVCSGLGALFACYVLYRAIRNCHSSSRSAPLPPVQPLAHHREHNVSKFEESISRPQTWFEPNLNLAAIHHFSRDSPGASRTSLLGKESPLLSPSICSTGDTAHEVLTSSQQLHNLPLPSPSYHNGRPGSSSSNNSSDASCSPSHPFPVTPDGSAQPIPRINGLRSGARRPRPISMSSMASNHTAVSRSSRYTVRGMPHAPHNNIQITLPTPLASANNSRDSLVLPTRRQPSGAYDRRSIVDSWLVIEPTEPASGYPNRRPSLEGNSQVPRGRQRPVSMSSLRTVVTSSDHMPPVPRLPVSLEAQSNRRSVSEARWTPSHQPVNEEQGESQQAKPARKANKLEKRRLSRPPS